MERNRTTFRLVQGITPRRTHYEKGTEFATLIFPAELTPDRVVNILKNGIGAPGKVEPFDGSPEPSLGAPPFDLDEAQTLLTDLRDCLESAPRIGAETDEPEGARGIEISDTLACAFAGRIRTLLGEPAPEAPAINATDAAIALAEEAGVNLSAVTGTGADGKITMRDVQAAIEAAAGD